MKKTKNLVANIAAAVALTLAGCGTTTTTTQPAAQTSQEPATYDVTPVDVESEVLTIADAIRLFDDNSKLAAMAKKYGYKQVGKYEAHNLNAYDDMMYKNCVSAKKLKDGTFQDMPKALKKGTSSYVGMIGGKIEIAVYNTKEYNKLVEQVKMAGFKLKEAGYEEEYSNGVYSIFCYASGKRVRIAKAL